MNEQSAPLGDAELEKSKKRPELLPYEPPKVESVKLSNEAAEALT